ncbi:hypothetical protein OROMI_031890 [Orobanche minor]
MALLHFEGNSRKKKKKNTEGCPGDEKECEMWRNMKIIDNSSE